MLEAEDTVMGWNDIRNAITNWDSFDESHPLPLDTQFINIAKAQAELSFKDGIKLVIKWTHDELGVDWSQEKDILKEWGI